MDQLRWRAWPGLFSRVITQEACASMGKPYEQPPGFAVLGLLDIASQTTATMGRADQPSKNQQDKVGRPDTNRLLQEQNQSPLKKKVSGAVSCSSLLPHPTTLLCVQALPPRKEQNRLLDSIEFAWARALELPCLLGSGPTEVGHAVSALVSDLSMLSFGQPCMDSGAVAA